MKSAARIAIAALCGIPLGILWGSKHSWLEVVEPLILYAAVVPKIVIFPVFILFLGIDVRSKLAVGAIAAFFPISLLTIAGMREVKKVYVDVARTIGASPVQIAKSVYLPAIAGQVFTGIRIGLGAAVTGALLGGNQDRQSRPGFHDRRVLWPVPHRRHVRAAVVHLYSRVAGQLGDEVVFGFLSPVSRKAATPECTFEFLRPLVIAKEPFTTKDTKNTKLIFKILLSFVPSW